MSNKILSQGIGKAMRKMIFTDATVYVKDEVLLRAFIDELNDRSTIKTKQSRLRCSDYLWYISYEGRLGMVSKMGSKNNAYKLIREKLIQKDAYGIYRGTTVIDGRGCQHPKHRPIIEAMGARWAPQIVRRLSDMLDGGHELQMVIDRDFESAYAPDYDVNMYIDDLVCSMSCMSERPDEAQEFYGAIDGCYVARFFNSDGEDIGRCIMYTDGKIRHFIRIYCYEEYQRDCLYTLKHNMKPGDLFGRSERIEGLCLPTTLNAESPNMYLDGSYYGLKVKDGKLWVGTDYDYDCKSTSDGTLDSDWEYIHECPCCGKMFSTRYRDNYIYDTGTDRCYCCEECAMEDGVYQCEECGRWTSDDIITNDGCHYCSCSCARSADYVRTEYNHDWVLRDDAIEVDGYYYADDEEMLADGWHKCDECDEWTRYRHKCADGKIRCDNCLSAGGWTLKYIKDVQDEETTEEHND